MDRKVKQIGEKLEREGRVTNRAGQEIPTMHYWMVVWQSIVHAANDIGGQVGPRIVRVGV